MDLSREQKVSPFVSKRDLKRKLPHAIAWLSELARAKGVIGQNERLTSVQDIARVFSRTGKLNRNTTWKCYARLKNAEIARRWMTRDQFVMTEHFSKCFDTVRLKEEALASTSHTCQSCGATRAPRGVVGPKIYALYVKHPRKHPELAFEPSNFQVLCDDCRANNKRPSDDF